MPDFGGAMDTLTDTDTAVMGTVGLAGFMAPLTLSNTLGPRLPVSVPSEAWGVAVVALVASMEDSVPMPQAAEAGALAYTGRELAGRAGVRSTIANPTGGN